jgi:hypothetical protein
MASNENLEVIVIDWLKTFAGVPVSSEKPKEPPVSYVLVDRTRGAREAMVLDRAEILIEVYHKSSRLTASNLANVIGDRLPELLSLNNDITHADVNSIVSLDDLIGGYRRYQVYCDIYHRR